MEVIEISDTQQQFNGETYYFCGFYFQRKGKRLHREVWKYHNGDIPKGYHVHHIDGNTHNNQIENLQLIDKNTHLSMHMSKPDRVEKSRKQLKEATKKAPEWHSSEDGKKWHSIRGKENWKLRKPITYTCSYCGKEFNTLHMYGKGQNHFCHPNCKAAYRRKRIKNESIVSQEDRNS